MPDGPRPTKVNSREEDAATEPVTEASAPDNVPRMSPMPVPVVEEPPSNDGSSSGEKLIVLGIRHTWSVSAIDGVSTPQRPVAVEVFFERGVELA
ncbi:hypothetical protein SNOG_13861 [Parastagonospora nodorum SN15]|nr:hypothetical protein SNOG_13861 [Parastagonospora nodorum SN15]EAT78885.2 hypothetical protein SNOG_13861 [Parastagonospora nodorum SN15]